MSSPDHRSRNPCPVSMTFVAEAKVCSAARKFLHIRWVLRRRSIFGVLLVAISGDATCLVQWHLDTKLTTAAYARPRCRVVQRYTRLCIVAQDMYLVNFLRIRRAIEITTNNSFISRLNLPLTLSGQTPTWHMSCCSYTTWPAVMLSPLAWQVHSAFDESLCCSICSETSHQRCILHWRPEQPLRRPRADPSPVPFVSR